MEQHAAALAVARETGDRHKQPRAHDGLAAALPDPGSHREQAMAIYRDLDVPEARA